MSLHQERWKKKTEGEVILDTKTTRIRNETKNELRQTKQERCNQRQEEKTKV